MVHWGKKNKELARSNEPLTPEERKDILSETQDGFAMRLAKRLGMKDSWQKRQEKISQLPDEKILEDIAPVLEHIHEIDVHMQHSWGTKKTNMETRTAQLVAEATEAGLPPEQIEEIRQGIHIPTEKLRHTADVLNTSFYNAGQALTGKNITQLQARRRERRRNRRRARK